MQEKEIHYTIHNTTFKAYVAFPEVIKERQTPAVLVSPTWMGRDQFVCDKARELAKLGYIGVAIDLYGNGYVPKDTQEAGQLTGPLFTDRITLRERVQAALAAVQELPSVNPDKIAAIGFCFGGLTVIELLRSGANIRAAISFHGVLGDEMMGIKAQTQPIASRIRGALLVLHGYKDPLVSWHDIMTLQKEMDEAGVDWQFNSYGLAAHAFTNPNQHDENSGMYFEPRANKRSWEEMHSFLQEHL